jgi:hypothetical protein
VQRTHFFSGHDYEDESDPNLTQVPDVVEPPQPLPVPEASPTSTACAKQMVQQSLGNIASVNEGLRLKRAFLDEVKMEEK